jgi:xanthine dehydrogenase small subunit
MSAVAAGTRFRLNGTDVVVAAPGGRRLLDVLRIDLGYPGTKEGCGEGECGACSILLDGDVVDSCLVPLCQVEGRDVRTVEGLATEGRLDDLQAALLETGGVQCGICTPGIVMAGRAFLDRTADGPTPTDDEIREAIAGNLCRCTGYGRIVDAIRLAAEGRAPAMAAPTAAEGAASTAWAAAVGPDPSRPRALPLLADPEADSPQALADAFALLADGGRRPIAGGTDTLVERAGGPASASRYLDLSRLSELRGIRLEGETLILGAGTTYAELRRDALVAAHAPVLAEMAAAVGAAQLQNRGTLGGNIATASPAGDSLPVLLALDAAIVVGGAHGERTVPAADFFPAYRRTALAPDELILRIEVPVVADRIAAFRKVGKRRAQAISVVAVAVAWRPDGDRWRDVRVALGSVAPTPIRARATEATLEGAPPTAEVAELAGRTLAAEISPIDDVRSTAAYRRAVAGRILRRIVSEAGAR